MTDEAGGDTLVRVEHAGGIRTIVLDSPHNRNALSSALLDQLADALDAARARTRRCAPSSSPGRVLCSARAPTSPNADRTAPNRMPTILTAIVESPVPVIARVNGHARAGGIGLVAAADLAVAPAAATFAFTEVLVGVAPAMIMVPALAVMQRRVLAQMVLTGERFVAADAASAGLLTAVVEDEPALDAWVRTRADALRKAAPGALRATKRLLRELPDQSWSEAMDAAAALSAELFAGDEASEGMEAFLQKRAPSWDRLGDGTT